MMKLPDMLPTPDRDGLACELTIVGELEGFYREVQVATAATKEFGLSLAVWNKGNAKWDIMLVHPDNVQLGIWELTKRPAGHWHLRIFARADWTTEYMRWWGAVSPVLAQQGWFGASTLPSASNEPGPTVGPVYFAPGSYNGGGVVQDALYAGYMKRSAGSALPPSASPAFVAPSASPGILEGRTEDGVEFVAVRKLPITPDASPSPRVGKTTTWHGPGRKPRSIAERVAAVKAWDAMADDQREELSEWLARHFGTEPGGGPTVQPQTFHSWRRRYRKRIEKS